MKALYQPLIKLCYICLLVLGSVYALSAQTTIYTDDFHYSNGTTNTAKWTTNTSGCNLSNSNDYFEIKGNKLEAKDIDCEATWQTITIDISDYDDVSVEVDLQESGNCEWNDYIKVYYIIDGGSETMFSTNGNNNDDFGNVTASQSGLNGSTLVVLAKVRNDNGSEKHRIKDILVEGTYAPSTCATDTAYFEPFNYSNGTSSSSQWSTYGDWNADQFEVRNGQFVATDIDNEAVWRSSVVDISNYTSVDVSVDLSTYGNSLDGSDFIKVFYKLNGGSEVLLDNGSHYNDFWNETATATGLSGSSIQIVIRADNDRDNETYLFDNILISGCNANATGGTSSISLTISGTDASCSGADDGSIELTVDDGASPFTYEWSNGATSKDITDLEPDVYVVTVSASDGATATASYTVEEPDAISISETVTNASCYNGTDGSISLSVSGGSESYTYTWSTGSSNSTLSSLGYNVYSVTVTDDNECEATKMIGVGQPDQLTAILTPSEETSAGAADGSISLAVSGGTSPYSYTWSNGETSQNIDDLDDGTYTVTITDNNGCSIIESAVVTTIAGYSGLNGYCYRLPLIIQASKVAGSTAHTDFPVLISVTNNALKNTTNGGHVEHSNGYDIVFTAADGTTLLSYQLDSYDAATGALTAWVKVPSLSTSSNTTIYAYYGNQNINTDGSSTATWRSSYKAVWHLDENVYANANIYDATANANNGEKKGTSRSNSYRSGKIGMAYKLDGSDDHYEIDNDLSTWLGSTATLSAWIKTDQWGEELAWNAPGITGFEEDGGVNDIFWGMIDYHGKMYGQAGDGSRPVTNSRVNDNNWHHITLTRNASNGQMKIYLDGAYHGSAYSESGLKTNSFYSLGKVIDDDGTPHYLEAQLDEVRILDEVLEVDWITTEYNNQNDPGTFVIADDEENANCLDTTITASACFTWLGSVSGDWTNPSNWSCGEVPTCNDSVVIPAGTGNTATITSGKTGYAKHLTIETGSTIAMGSTGTLRICGDLNVNGSLDLSNGTVIFQGDTTQYITSSNTTITLNDVSFNNSGVTGVVLNNSIEIRNTVSFSDGYVYTDTDTLFLLNDDGGGSTILAYSDSSYIIGKLNRAIDRNTDDYTFPVGKTENNELMWLTIKNGNLNGTENITCWFSDLERNNNNDINFTDQDITYMAMHPKGMWTVEPNEQPSSGKYEIRVNIEHFDGLEDNNFGVLKRPKGNNANSWNNGNGSTGPLGLLGRVLSGGFGSLKNLTSFSEFGVGTGGGSSLPIQLTSFTAEYLKEDGHVKLDWITEVEINNDYFIVQRSIDGYHYEDVAEVKGAGNSSVETYYTAYDQNPPTGLVYYRLKQYDFDGKYQYSDVVSVMVFHTAVNSVKVYPNPANSFVNIELATDSEQVNVMILDMNGNLVKMLNGEHGGGTFNSRIELESYMPAGQYLVKIKAGNTENVKKLMIVH